MLVESKYLQFVRNHTKETGSTQVWDILNTDQIMIGRIGWYSQWRRYVFGPMGQNVMFDKDCLLDIIKAIDKLMIDHKIELQNRKTNAL